MRQHRITDADVDRLLRGEIPAGRIEDAPLADALAEYRAAVSAPVARPSAALRERLEASGVPAVSIEQTRGVSGAALGSATGGAEGSARARGPRRLLGGVLGIGIGGALLLGAAGAAVAAGTAGTLPPVIQEGFDAIVGGDPGGSSTVGSDGESGESADSTTQGVAGAFAVPAPAATPTDAPTDVPSNFGQTVSDEAQDGSLTGREFGKWVSEQAQQNGNSGNGNSGNGNGNSGNGSGGSGTTTSGDDTVAPDSGAPSGGASGGSDGGTSGSSGGASNGAGNSGSGAPGNSGSAPGRNK